LGLGAPLRQHFFPEKIKVLHLAEKMRVIGGNPVNEKMQLLLPGGRAEQLAILMIIRQLKLAQPLGEP
jgi:hypothetical protein